MLVLLRKLWHNRKNGFYPVCPLIEEDSYGRSSKAKQAINTMDHDGTTGAMLRLHGELAIIKVKEDFHERGNKTHREHTDVSLSE